MSDISSNNPLIGAAPAVPMTWFPGRVRPYNNIQPFTYRDGETYLDVQEALRNWLEGQLVPFVDSTFLEYQQAFNAEVAKLSMYAAEFQQYIETQKTVFDGKIDEYTQLVNKAVSDFTALANNAMTTTAANATRAENAAARAEQFASTVVAFQDAAVKALMNDPNSQTAKQIAVLVAAGVKDVDNRVTALNTRVDGVSGVTMEAIVMNSLKGRQMISHGHSYVVGANIQSPNKWVEQFARLIGAVYPTLATDNDLMRAVSGSRVEEAAQRIISTTFSNLYWRQGSDSMPFAEALINTARKNGIDDATKAGALNAMRTIALMPNVRARFPAGNGRHTFSAGWLDTAVPVSMSGTVKAVPSSQADTVNVQFSLLQETAYIMFLASKQGNTGVNIYIDNVTGGGRIRTVNNTNQSAADTPNGYVPMPIKITGNVGDVIKISREAGTGTLIFDGVCYPYEKPRPMFFMKEPYLKDYSLSTSYPNGSDAGMDFFNDVLDTIKAEWPMSVVANPNVGGYWDKNTMIQSDGVHPNEAGSAALARCMYDAVRAQLPVATVKALTQA